MEDIKIYSRAHRVNRVINEIDALYHIAAFSLGLSDSVAYILYMIYDNGGSCSLSAIVNSGICKQTVNSAVRKLEGEGILFLDKRQGKGKIAILTEKGRALSENTVATLLLAEETAFAEWTDGEIETYIALNEKYLNDFGKQIASLESKGSEII